MRSVEIGKRPRISDRVLFEKIKNGIDFSCDRYAVLGRGQLNLNNFKPSLYKDPALKNRLLRRVVFSEVPLEVRQNSNLGVFDSDVTDPEVRKNLSLWFVTFTGVREDRTSMSTYLEPPVLPHIVARGFQSDKRSVAQFDPQQVRMVSFNKDVSATPSNPPIAMTFLTDEKLQFVTETYVPLSKASLLANTTLANDPVSGLPVLSQTKSIYHQNERWENDAYLYGKRDLEIENIAVISNFSFDVAPNGSSMGSNYFDASTDCRKWGVYSCASEIPAPIEENSLFALKGFWNLPTLPSESKSLECALNRAPPGAAVSASEIATNSSMTYTQMIARTGASHLPPSSSNFYNQQSGGPYLAKNLMPFAFQRQFEAIGSQVKRSNIYYRGILYRIPFLTRTLKVYDSETMDIGTDGSVGHAHNQVASYNYVANRFYRSGSSNATCDQISQHHGFLTWKNLGTHQTSLETPSDEFQNLGFFYNSPLPALTSAGDQDAL